MRRTAMSAQPCCFVVRMAFSEDSRHLLTHMRLSFACVVVQQLLLDFLNS